MTAPAPGVGDPLPSFSVVADEVRLFCYSALTWNPHRIHYDAPYAVEREGYPGLVVHGPFMSGLLLRGAQQWVAGRGRITGARSRSSVPAFSGESLTFVGEVTGVDGDLAELSVRLLRSDGAAACEGTVHVRLTCPSSSTPGSTPCTPPSGR
ncbi:hypothetical protein H7X46_18105 [Pseudonocardia sp. C8]|uniref:hypothetical protein n=1 Tax=Pseudonocardia sp. C8 TaxID=2762759 RepID=UPI0016435CDF|nr:hypothetical protein [Pseudonocardia sp. C8]MBC3192975.1 hypothetical protein [Pseudonocardia sp. C8]